MTTQDIMLMAQDVHNEGVENPETRSVKAFAEFAKTRATSIVVESSLGLNSFECNTYAETRKHRQHILDTAAKAVYNTAVLLRSGYVGRTTAVVVQV